MTHEEIKIMFEKYKDLTRRLRILYEHLENSIIFIKPKVVDISVQSSTNPMQLTSVERSADRLYKINSEIKRVTEERAEIEESYISMIGILNEEDADLIKSHYRDGLPLWQIAKTKEYSNAYARVRLHRILKKIAKAL